MGDGCLHRLTLLLPARQTVPDAFEPGSGSRQVSDHTATPWQVSLSRVLNLEQISGQAPSSANRMLTDAEVTALADDINQFLAEDKVKLHVAHPHRWYLIGEGLCSMYRLPPEQLAFSGVGVDADAEVAETPAPSGDDPWLHSAASTAQVPVVEAASFDELCQSLQGLDDETAGVVVLEQHERRHLLASDPKRATAAQAQFDASWIQPAQAALRSGQLQQIHYQYDNGQFSLETAPRGGAFSRWTKRLLGR